MRNCCPSESIVTEASEQECCFSGRKLLRSWGKQVLLWKDIRLLLGKEPCQINLFQWLYFYWEPATHEPKVYELLKASLDVICNLSYYFDKNKNKNKKPFCCRSLAAPKSILYIFKTVVKTTQSGRERCLGSNDLEKTGSHYDCHSADVAGSRRGPLPLKILICLTIREKCSQLGSVSQTLAVPSMQTWVLSAEPT